MMHLRKSRKAKVAASEFVKRVISGKDVSPERKETSSAKGSRPTTPKQKGKGATASGSRVQSKSPSRGRPSSPKPARPNSPKAASSSGTPTPSTSQRATSRSPSRARETKSSLNESKGGVKEDKTPVPTKTGRPRGRPRKYPKVDPTQESGSKSESSKESKKNVTPVPTPTKEATSTKEAVEGAKRSDRRRGSKSAESSPVAKDLSSSKVEKKLSEGAASSKVFVVKSNPACTKPPETKNESKPCKKAGSENTPLPPSTSIPQLKNAKVITPKIVFVDSKGESLKSDNSGSTTSSPVKPAVDLGTISPIKLAPGVRISPTAKILPVTSLQNITSMSPGAKGAFTISNASLLSLASQGTHLLVSSNPDGTLTTSPVSAANASIPEGPGQFKIDLVELAKTVSAMTPPQPSASRAMCETPSQSSPTSGSSPLYKKSPKLFLSASKHPRDEPISEGKIKKRKRPKIPDWDVPSAIYQTQFSSPQKEFTRADSPIRYPEDKGMEKKDYFDIVGIVNKADVKKANGKEHRNHRLAGGKLRRVCKPKISPEMVYRKFSLARGCIMHDVLVDYDEEHDGNSPRVGDKTAVIKTEQCKKGSLSPKMHDSYRQHCNKIPVISIEKVNKGGSGEGEENSPEPDTFFDRNEPFGRDGTPKSKKGKDRHGLASKNKSSKTGAKGKQTDLKTTGSKGLTKSKSFEMPRKGSGKASLIKVKSMPTTSQGKKPSAGSINLPEEEVELDDGSKRRSARFKGSKRKQWWHLLRANPDEFEEDKEWDKEIALQEAKKQARIDRKIQREGSDEEEDEEVIEEEEENEIEEIISPKKSPKKLKKKVKIEKLDKEIKEEPQDDIIEISHKKPKKKKKQTRDQALAKKVSGDAQGAAEVREGGASQETVVKKGVKRKATDTNMDPPLQPPPKKIKEEPVSDQELENESDDRRSGKGKKKKLVIIEKEEELEEKKLIKDVVILGEDGEPLDIKYHTAVYDQVHAMLENKDPEELATTGIMELSVPPYSPQSFIEILARQQQSRRPHSPLGMLPIVRSDIVYKTAESECIAPHMCSVCWINDHMYCRNMKRIARDLPLSGRCIHYVPCDHFRQKDSPSSIGRRRMNRKLHNRALATYDINKLESSSQVISSPSTQKNSPPQNNDSNNKTAPGSPPGAKEELMCEEILTESDSEPHSPVAGPPPGTELLKYELRARAGQIKRALGFRRLPVSISPMKRRLQSWGIVEEEEEYDDDTREVEIEEFGAFEEVGLAYFPEPVIIPLSGDFVVKESSMRREGWRDDSSVFMPNTEEDAMEKDQDEITSVKNELGVYKDYEESLYGENSQDSTETSLSQNSPHEYYESDGSQGGSENKRDLERRRKRRKRKTEPHVGPVRVDSTCDGSSEGLRNKWQQSEDGTQVLTFTTKEIRERKPELLQYVKRAGLVGVITEKLQNERKSIQKLVKEADQVLRQSQDKLEQHRCLMAAVLTEIVCKKEQLRDLQTALVDEEAMCVKLRKENRMAVSQVQISGKKFNILKRILLKSKELSPAPKSGEGDQAGDRVVAVPQPESQVRGSGAGDGPVPMDIVEIKPEVEEQVVDKSNLITLPPHHGAENEVEVATDGGEEAMETGSVVLESEGFMVGQGDISQQASAIISDECAAVLDSSSMRLGIPIIACDSSVVTTDAASLVANSLRNNTGLPTGIVDISPEIAMLESEIPMKVGASAVRRATATGIGATDSQVLNVHIEGGQSGDGRMVMLELPLESASNLVTQATSNLLTGAPATAFSNVLLDKPLISENLLVEGSSVPLARQHLTQMVTDSVLTARVSQQQVSGDASSAKSLRNLLTGRSSGADTITVPSNYSSLKHLKQIPILPGIFAENINIQDVNLVSQNFQTQDLSSGNNNLGSGRGPQPAQAAVVVTTTATTLPQSSNFESIILQSDDISHVLQPGASVGDLPLQQGDIGNLIVQEGDLNKDGASSIGGLLVEQQQQTPQSKQSDVGGLAAAVHSHTDLRRAATQLGAGFVLPQNTLPSLGLDSVNISNILTDQQQLDNVLIQGNIGDNILLQQNVQPQDNKLLVPDNNSASILLQTTSAGPAAPAPAVSQPGILIQQQSTTPSLLQPHHQNPTAADPTTVTTVFQAPLSAPAPSPSTSASPSMVIDTETLLQNINLMPSQLGQVQTIMINGQPFEVILQAAEN